MILQSKDTLLGLPYICDIVVAILCSYYEGGAESGKMTHHKNDCDVIRKHITNLSLNVAYDTGLVGILLEYNSRPAIEMMLAQ
jgi:hypothetical protein